MESQTRGQLGKVGCPSISRTNAAILLAGMSPTAIFRSQSTKICILSLKNCLRPPWPEENSKRGLRPGRVQGRLDRDRLALVLFIRLCVLRLLHGTHEKPRKTDVYCLFSA